MTQAFWTGAVLGFFLGCLFGFLRARSIFRRMAGSVHVVDQNAKPSDSVGTVGATLGKRMADILDEDDDDLKEAREIDSESHEALKRRFGIPVEKAICGAHGPTTGYRCVKDAGHDDFHSGCGSWWDEEEVRRRRKRERIDVQDGIEIGGLQERSAFKRSDLGKGAKTRIEPSVLRPDSQNTCVGYQHVPTCRHDKAGNESCDPCGRLIGNEAGKAIKQGREGSGR